MNHRPTYKGLLINFCLDVKTLSQIKTLKPHTQKENTYLANLLFDGSAIVMGD